MTSTRGGWATVRVPIAAAMAAVTVVVLSVTGIVVDQRTFATGKDRLREQARERLSAAVTLYEVDGRLSTGASTSPDFPPEELVSALSGDAFRATWYDGGAMWASQRTAADEILTVRLDAEPLHRDQRDLRRTLLLSTAIALIAAGLVGWLAAVGVSRRLRRAAALATAWPNNRRPEGPGLLDSVGGRDEVAALSAAVDTMALELAARVERERRFGADVAHELRTPLTGLLSASELLPDDDASRLLRKQAKRMQRLVEDLLDLFRLEAGQEQVSLVRADLADAVRQAVEVSACGPVDLAVEGSAEVQLEHRRLERILVNLVANARTHGGIADTEPVTVMVHGRDLVVRDGGSGFPPELLADGPQPFRRYSQRPGSGLGLAIVAQMASLLGAAVSFANDQGAKVTVTFAP